MVNLNGMLHGPNSKLFLAGGGLAVLVVAFEYRKSKSLGTAPADSSAIAGTADYSANADGYDYSTDTRGLFGYPSPGGGGSGNSGGNNSGGASAPGTNAQWSQLVQSVLIQQGYQPTVVAAALGHYIVGTAMSKAEYDIVQAGIALEGQPPQSVPPLHVTPAPAAPKPNLDGWYLCNPYRTYWQVQKGIRYHVLNTTVLKMRQSKQEPAWKPVLANNPVFALPRGRDL